MEGQGVLTGFEGPGYREVQFLDSIFESLVSSVEAGGGDSGFLKKKTTKLSKSSASGYTAVFLSTFTALDFIYAARTTTFLCLISWSI